MLQHMGVDLSIALKAGLAFIHAFFSYSLLAVMGPTGPYVKKWKNIFFQLDLGCMVEYILWCAIT